LRCRETGAPGPSSRVVLENIGEKLDDLEFILNGLEDYLFSLLLNLEDRARL